MKHASRLSLEGLEPLLAALRSRTGLREKNFGVFYWRSKPFLHFHEDPARLFADVMVEGVWGRFAVNTSAERERALGAVDGVVG
jgi:hypothetical protein